MKTNFVFIAICLALVQCENFIENKDIGKLGPQIRIPNKTQIQELIDNKLKELREQGFNDYKFDNIELPINNEEHGINVNIKATGEVRGLLDCNVKVVSGALFTWKFNIQWTQPIEVNIEPYDLQGFVQMIKVFGKGKFSLLLEDVSVDLTILAKIWPGDANSIGIRKLVVQNVSFKHNFELTGWLNNEVISKSITQFVNDSLQPILEIYDTEIKTAVSNFITEKVENIKIPLK